MKKNHLLYILCGLALICSCSDTSFEQSGGGGTATNAMLNVQLNIPGMSATSATRAASEADEKQIDTMDALVFDANDKFLYRAAFSTMTTVNGTTTVTFFVREITAEVHIYLLANARDQVGAATLTEGDTYDDVMKQMLTDAVPTVGGIHKLGTPFPMWGRLVLSSIVEGSNDGGTVNMLRSVARIDVGLNYNSDAADATAQGLTNFELKEVYLYVVRDKGYIAPALESFENDDYTKVVASTLQGESERNTINYTDGTQFTAEVTDNLHAIEREMYIYEADGRLREDFDVTRVIVGGIYKGDDTSNTTVTYYTLYLTDQNSSGGFDTYGREILRNHNYRFNITKVTGPGRDLPEPDEPQHMEAELVEWEAKNYNQSFTGQYTIAGEATLWFDKSGEGSLEIFSDNPSPLELLTPDMISTAYDSIPEYNPTLGIGWIYMDYYDDGAGNTYPFKVTQDANNSNLYLIEGKATENQTADERGGDDDYFYIKIGNDILKRIYLKQSKDDTELQLSVTQRYLQFSRSGYAPYPATANTTLELEMEWEPIGATITITDLDPNKLNTRIHPIAAQLTTNGFTSTVDKTGLTTSYLNLKCHVDSEYPDDILERQSTTWEVTATYGDQVKTIYVTAERFDYGIDPKLSDVILDGDDYNFPVRSNASWKAEVTADGNAVTGIGDLEGGVDNEYGYELSVGTIDITTGTGGSSVYDFNVKFTSPTDAFAPVTYSYKGFGATKVGDNERANSIIYPATGDALSIPAGKWAAASLSEGGIGSAIIIDEDNGINPTLFTGEIVWTDNSAWVPAAATDMTKAYVFACGNGTSTKLYVRRGDSGNGNMVVALKKDDYTISTWGNKIVWSWHIWGTGYDPAATGGMTYNTDAEAAKQQYWMTRDLGAFADDWNHPIGAISGNGVTIYYTDPVSGLCYQFGRKDPISQKAMYDAKGAAISRTIIQSSDIDQNVAKTSIVYPQNMMHADFWSGTYIADDVQNSWGGTTGQKMNAFDPCPYGYKVSNKVIGSANAMGRWIETKLSEYSSSTGVVLGVDTEVFYGGKHPRTGYVNDSFNNGTGRLMWVADGTRSSGTDYWNSTHYMVHWTYTPTGSLSTSVIRPSNALKVRCVKEQQ